VVSVRSVVSVIQGLNEGEASFYWLDWFNL